MKHMLITVGVALVTLVVAHPVLAEEEVVVTVKGMVCSFCAQGLKKTFNKKPEVNGIDVDLDAKTVKIRFKDGAVYPDAEIEQLIKDAGYDVAKIEKGSKT